MYKFQYVDERFAYQNVFTCDPYKKDDTNTLTSDGTYVYVCLFLEDSIQQYTIDGELLQTFGGRNSMLRCPLVSGVDDKGNILVTGLNRRRAIDVLKVNGSLASLQINWRNQLEQYPVCARVVGSKLFVKPFEKPLQVFKIIWK